MDKEKYLVDLESAIKQLPEDERCKIIAKYEQLIAAANLVTESEIEQHFGTARQLGRQILAENALEVRKRIQKHHPQLLSVNWHAFLMMMMAVYSSPMTYLTGIAGMTLEFLAGLIIFLIGFVIIVGLSAATVLGGVLIYAGIGTLGMAFAVGMFHLGIGLLFIAFNFFIVPLIHRIYVALFAGLSNVGQKIYVKFKVRWKKNLRLEKEAQ